MSEAGTALSPCGGAIRIFVLRGEGFFDGLANLGIELAIGGGTSGASAIESRRRALRHLRGDIFRGSLGDALDERIDGAFDRLPELAIELRAQPGHLFGDCFLRRVFQ